MRVNTWVRLPGSFIVLGLIAGMTLTSTTAPAMATATCPTVNPSTGAVTPAPAAGVDWAGCNLTGADLRGADLAGAQLQGATLTQAVAANANLSNANLFGATLTGAVLSGDLSGVNLSTASVSGLSLSGDARSADLENLMNGGMDLIGASLQKADLRGADLDNSQIQSDDFFGATLTGASDANALWLNDTCPDGASSAYYSNGCLSMIDVTTPSATPVVTAGTVGNNGWYTSGVTVSWFWVDTNSLVAATCPSSTSTVTQGIAVAISASCTDSAGHVGHDSIVEQIDTSPPAVTLTGVTKGAIYPFGLVPMAQCLTTDAYSGVAANAGGTTLGGRPDGTGVLTAECTGATDKAGNQARTVTATYQVLYAFGGFMSPLVGSTLKVSARTINVSFVLTDVTGTPISARTAAALASTFDVRATLRGPAIAPDSSACAWQSRGKHFQCVIVIPRHVLTGHRHPYSITVTENLGGGYKTAPIDFYSQNPAPFYFR